MPDVDEVAEATEVAVMPESEEAVEAAELAEVAESDEAAELPEAEEVVEVAQEEVLAAEPTGTDAQEGVAASCTVQHIDLQKWIFYRVVDGETESEECSE